MKTHPYINDTFNLNLYLYNNYVSESGKKFDNYLVFDTNTEYTDFLTYENHVQEIKDDPNQINNASDLADKMFKLLRHRGDESSTEKRKIMLKKYYELKDKDDFNDPKKASEYAKQIVDSYQ